MRSTAALILVVFGIYSTGCSLMFTKGPQPEVQPPPPCTTDNGWPIADTVLAALSVAAAVAGGVLMADYNSRPRTTCNPNTDPFCALGNGLSQAEQASGIGAVVLGVAGVLAFTPSAVVGFNRTAACRASLESKPHQTASSALPQSSFLLVPERGCPSLGDAPRNCSAVALDEARH